MSPDIFFTIFFFLVGACIGSFLNVVVYRLPANRSLILPPSQCPHCKHALAWFDNLPIIGWIMLKGRCRYCAAPISLRYPLVEFFTAIMFAGMYWLIFVDGNGPFFARWDSHETLLILQRWYDIARFWPMFTLYIFAAAILLGISLIDYDHFLIPPVLPTLLACAAVLTHALVDRPAMPGNLLCHPFQLAVSIGGCAGLLIAIGLLKVGILPLSFAEGDSPLESEKIAHEQKLLAAENAEVPPLDVPTPILAPDPALPPALDSASEEEMVDYSSGQIRIEILKEMLFLLFPIFFAAVAGLLETYVPSIGRLCIQAALTHWMSGLFGSLLGGLIGGFSIWLVRILGSLAFGKEAMGLGDIDLMFAVGTLVGGLYSIIVILISPALALPITCVVWLFTRRHQLPFGPYLSAATLFILLFPFPIYDYLRPGIYFMNLYFPRVFG